MSTEVEIIQPREQKIILLHHLTYPEVLTAKKGVSDMNGYLVGGPDRRGANAIHPTKLWQAWQRDVQIAAQSGAVAPAVADYFQRTKGLTAPPKEGVDVRIYGSSPSVIKEELVFPGGETHDPVTISAGDPDSFQFLAPQGEIIVLDEGLTSNLEDLPQPADCSVGLQLNEASQGENMLDLGINLDGLAGPAPAPNPCQGKLAKPPHFATSFSGMEEFQQCPYKWAAAKYYKVVPYEESESAAWGNRVHKAAEDYLKNAMDQAGRRIDEEALAPAKRYCDYFIATGAELLVEKEICCAKDLQPCGWKDWNTVWFRFKGDLFALKDRKLTYIDWKSGKRKDDVFQIEVAAALADLYFGEKFDTFDGKMVFVKETDPKKAVVGLPRPLTKADIPLIWERIFAITNRMEQAWETANFRMQTNGLCKQYCGNMYCVHNGRRG